MSTNNRSPLAGGRGRCAAVCLAVACVLIVASAEPAAAQVSYLYNGNTFNLFSCGGNTLCPTPNPSNTSYRTSNFVTAVLTLAEPLPPNLFMQDVTGRPGFRLIMADGRQTMTATAGYAGGFEAKVSTDADGQIVAPWNLIINCCQFPNNGIASLNSPFGAGIPGARGVGDSGTLSAPTAAFPNTPLDTGRRQGAPGTWTAGPAGTATRTIFRGNVYEGFYDYDFINAGGRDSVSIGLNGPPRTSSFIMVSPGGIVYDYARLTADWPRVGAYAATSGGCIPAGLCSSSVEAAGRGVAYQTVINPTGAPLTMKFKALLDGRLSGTGGHAFAGLYVFKTRTFSDTITNSGRTPAEFMLRRDDLLRLARGGDPHSSQHPTLSLKTLFPPDALLDSKTELVVGPPDQALDVPITSALITLGVQEAVTVVFDLAVYAPPGGFASFAETLRAAPDFITDEFGDPVPGLVAIGAVETPPPPAASLTLGPADATSPAGTAHSVTATARAADGTPVSDQVVTFSITAGPNAGLTQQIPTDADGEATFSYVGTAPGADSIQASTPALQSDVVTNAWTAGPLHHIAISPASTTIVAGGSQGYTAEAFDAFNNSRGDVTGSTAFSILPDGSCAGAVCSATTPGAHTVTGTHNGAAATAMLTVVAASSYVFEGFFRPIDMSPPGRTVWNVVVAGQTIPAKWRLTRDGSPVSDPVSFAGLASYPVDCTSGAGPAGGAVGESPPGRSGLSYKGDGNWHFNWKTPDSYKGTCRVLFVRFEDGIIGPGASFKFK